MDVWYVVSFCKCYERMWVLWSPGTERLLYMSIKFSFLSVFRFSILLLIFQIFIYPQQSKYWNPTVWGHTWQFLPLVLYLFWLYFIRCMLVLNFYFFLVTWTVFIILVAFFILITLLFLSILSHINIATPRFLLFIVCLAHLLFVSLLSTIQCPVF